MTLLASHSLRAPTDLGICVSGEPECLPLLLYRSFLGLEKQKENKVWP